MKYFFSLQIFSGQMGGYYNPYAGSFSAAHMAAAAAAAAAQQTGQVSRSSKAHNLDGGETFEIRMLGVVFHGTKLQAGAYPQIFSGVRNIFSR